MKNGFLNGLMAAAAAIVLFLIINAVDPKANFGLGYMALLTTIIYLFFMVRAGRQERSKYGGSLTFGEAIIPAFMTFVVSSIIYNTFYILMLKLNPNLVEMAVQASMEVAESIAGMLGSNPDDIAINLEEQNQEEALRESMTNISTYFSSTLISIFFPGILFTIIAALFAKKKASS